ncbi:MAG: STAS domain-containing protein [Bacteroidota bacterium]
MEFSFKITSETPVVKIELYGRLMDKAHASELLSKMDALILEGKNRFILNLTAMDYMNSSGLNTMVNMLTKARSKGGEVLVANVSKKVKELFIITKLNTLFTVTENMEEAEKHFSN